MKSKLYPIVNSLNILEEEVCLTPDGEIVCGQTSPLDNLIELEMKLSNKDKFRTMFHELCHIMVFEVGKELSKADPDWEGQADNFATIMENLFAKYPPLVKHAEHLANKGWRKKKRKSGKS